MKNASRSSETFLPKSYKCDHQAHSSQAKPDKEEHIEPIRLVKSRGNLNNIFVGLQTFCAASDIFTLLVLPLSDADSKAA